MIRVLGIDPGSLRCGYGALVVDGRALRYLECGTLTAPADQPMERRLGEIARGLREVIAEMAPEVLSVEDVFSHVNPRTALALAQARGMVLAVAGMAGLPVFSYAPALVKKSVVGSGRADKDQVARMVASVIGLRSPPPADAADALAIALTHARTLVGGGARLTSAVIERGAGTGRAVTGRVGAGDKRSRP
ncbi:MAG: crossover junction endodeoxyribonuclease RuvC [Kofleriaceae bacterium]|nr:crossover junction endodeoxyribonuclease RuvC [Kofleriaceae bacterium]MBP6841266.1 crossover junction endodeoxyribonuclease RuvC [Kofleriaceae bacterium]MBP9207960.1 crossover junction endodeoxyribonuclease RuvC [Kofleriaceae bacterium]